MDADTIPLAPLGFTLLNAMQNRPTDKLQSFSGTSLLCHPQPSPPVQVLKSYIMAVSVVLKGAPQSVVQPLQVASCSTTTQWLGSVAYTPLSPPHLRYDDTIRLPLLFIMSVNTASVLASRYMSEPLQIPPDSDASYTQAAPSSAILPTADTSTSQPLHNVLLRTGTSWYNSSVLGTFSKWRMMLPDCRAVTGNKPNSPYDWLWSIRLPCASYTGGGEQVICPQKQHVSPSICMSLTWQLTLYSSGSRL